MFQYIALYGPFMRGGMMHQDLASLKFIRNDTVILADSTVKVEVFEITPADLAKCKEAWETRDYKMVKKTVSDLTVHVLAFMPLENNNKEK